MESLYRSTPECPTRVKGRVTGRIPSWLVGGLYRNGPGIYEVGDSEYNHWFDGLAMLHHFDISEGTVSYTSRYIQTETYKDNLKVNRIIVSEYGTASYPDPCKNIFQRMFAWFKPTRKTDNTVVTVTPFGKALYTATETHALHKLDPDTLETLGVSHIEESLPVTVATAHMLQDEKGNMYNMGKAYDDTPRYSFVKIPKPIQGKDIFDAAEVIGSVPFRWKYNPTYLHSFSMTENFCIFVEQPLCISVLRLMATKLTNKTFSECLRWYGDEKSVFHVIDKRTGEEVCPKNPYVAEPFFMFHHINSYEEDGQLVVDVSAYEDNTNMNLYYLKNLRTEKRSAYPEPTIRRYVLPLTVPNQVKTGDNLINVKTTSATAIKQQDDSIKCGYETLGEVGFDLPAMNDNYRAVKHRYMYGAGGAYFNTIVKLDAGTHESWTWQEEGVYVSEPIFVSSPGATTEDDGVLLTVLYELKVPRHRTSVLVLDARTMSELGRATFDVPLGRDIHGCFVKK